MERAHRPRWRRWLRIAGLGAAIVLAVMVTRGLLNGPEPFDPGPAPALPSVDAEGVAERLAAAVRIRSISPRPEHPEYPERAAAMRALHEHLRQQYPRVHQALEREVVAELSLLYRWPGSDPAAAPILLLAHMDVVPVEPGTEADWTRPPFSGDIVDGVVWGRGTMDDKAGVVGLMSAVERLLEEGFVPTRTIVIALGHDEEIGGEAGAGAMARVLEQRGQRFAFVLDEGGAIVSEAIPGLDREAAMVGVAEKGLANIELSLEDEGGHSSMPPPRGAIGRLAEAVRRLEDEPMPARSDGPTRMMLEGLAPHMRTDMRIVLSNLWLLSPVIERVLASRPATNATLRTTIVPTIVDAGVAANVLPSQATATLNARILPGQTVQDVLEHVRAVVDDPGIEVRCPEDCWEPSEVSSPQGEGYQVVRRAIAHVFPEAVTVPFLVVGATDSRHYAGLTDQTYRFLPLRMRAADRKRMHGTDEQNTVQGIADAVRFYMAVVMLAAG
ncbi:MAG: M20 family peptidase [Myxococcales bacterium]|nr:M20 family peptidase [Myxococcales bacterium]